MSAAAGAFMLAAGAGLALGMRAKPKRGMAGVSGAGLSGVLLGAVVTANAEVAALDRLRSEDPKAWLAAIKDKDTKLWRANAEAIDPEAYIDACWREKNEACVAAALEKLAPAERAKHEARLAAAKVETLRAALADTGGQSAPQSASSRLGILEELLALTPQDAALRQTFETERAARLEDLRAAVKAAGKEASYAKVAALQEIAQLTEDPRDAEAHSAAMTALTMQNDQRARPEDYVDLDVAWRNTYSVMTARFTFVSRLSFAVQDPKVRCQLFAGSGRELGAVETEVYVQIPARRRVRSDEINLGFVDQQAKTTRCAIESFSPSAGP